MMTVVGVELASNLHLLPVLESSPFLTGDSAKSALDNSSMIS
jgi:hypothetical protein